MDLQKLVVPVLQLSTPVTTVLPMYSQRRSSLLGLPAEFAVDDRKKRVEIETGYDDTPPAGRSLIAVVMRGKVVVFPKLENLI